MSVEDEDKYRKLEFKYKKVETIAKTVAAVAAVASAIAGLLSLRGFTESPTPLQTIQTPAAPPTSLPVQLPLQQTAPTAPSNSGTVPSPGANPAPRLNQESLSPNIKPATRSAPTDDDDDDLDEDDVDN